MLSRASRLRAGTVAAAGALLLAATVARAWRDRERGPVAKEVRLFPIGQRMARVIENPDGRVALAVWRPAAGFPATGRPLEPAKTAAWRMPTGPGARRQIRPLPSAGTWWLEGDRLRMAWRYSVRGRIEPGLWWTDDESLAETVGVKVLDLRTGRALPAGNRIGGSLLYGEDRFFPGYGIGEDEQGDASALEAAPGEAAPAANLAATEFAVGERGVRLRFAADSGEQPSTDSLWAETVGEAPVSLRLGSSGFPLHLSRDGRHLWLMRNRTLWRLDFARPLTELLDAAAPPALPLPEELLQAETSP